MSDPDAGFRAGRDADAEAIIALIGACWAEYPGVVLDVDGEEPELRTLASAFAAKGGMFWVAEGANGAIVGMAGVRPAPQGDLPDAWEIARVYVDANQRGGGLAQTLMAKAEAHARATGARHLVLHSDTRFLRAHRFYARLGYVRHGRIKVLNDRSMSMEFGYAKPVDGAWVLDAAAAASTVPGLAALIRAAAGEGVLFDLGPAATPAATEAKAELLARMVASGTGALALGWRDGRLAGFTALTLPAAATEAHRAGFGPVFVAPSARRQGLGRELAAAAIAAAEATGRQRLVATVPASTAARGFAAVLGWREAGRIDDYARPDGAARAALILVISTSP